MAILGPFINGTAWFAGYNLSGVANKIEFAAHQDDLDNTTFTSAGAKTRQGGLWDSSSSVDGYAEFGTGLEDPTVYGALAVNTHVLTITPTGADGATAYFASILLDGYKVGGNVGTILPFNAMFKGRDAFGPIRGIVGLPRASYAAGATNGTITQLGAVSATQRVYAAVHVFSVAGTTPTLDVVVQSAAAIGFASPTTRLTIPTQNAVGDAFGAPVLGAVTDQFWRVQATVGGTATPSFSAAVVLAIQ